MTCTSWHGGASCELRDGHDGDHRAVVPTDEYLATLTWPNPAAVERAEREARESERLRHPASCPAWWNTVTDAFPCDCPKPD